MKKKQNLAFVISFHLLAAFIMFCFFCYVLMGIIMYSFQDRFLYRPSDQNFYDCHGFSYYDKQSYNGTRFYYRETTKEKIIVYYHGNVGSACDRSVLKFGYGRMNTTLAFVEYAGYSNDSVEPSKERILQDVRNMEVFLDSKNFTEVVVIGDSLGTGVASYHASIGDIDSLVLLAPFYSTSDLAKDKFPFYPVKMLYKDDYDNSVWLQDYEGPLAIVHGVEDKNIPVEHGLRLFRNASTETKTLTLVPDVGHNNLYNSRETWNAIRKAAGIE